MLKAIKNFFKREQHTHYNTTNSVAALCTWENCMYALLPNGKLYRLNKDFDGYEQIQEIRLGY